MASKQELHFSLLSDGIFNVLIDIRYHVLLNGLGVCHRLNMHSVHREKGCEGFLRARSPPFPRAESGEVKMRVLPVYTASPHSGSARP